jgi:histidinol-phosphatase (PHP family)
MNYFADTHTHSNCSPDGSDSMLEMAKAAEAAGLEELCITDHCDFLSMQGTITLDFDWAPLRAGYDEVKSHNFSTLTVCRGIEIAGICGFEDNADEILQEPLDFVLGSVHNLSVESGCTDFYDLDYRKDPTLCRRCMEDYFTSLEGTVAWNGFDSLAHVPYLLRYMRDRDGVEVSMAEYEDRIRPLFRTLAENGKALELNTCRGRSVGDYSLLFRWFREEGGTLVTLGSDAHTTQDVGKGIAEGQELLRSLGYTYFCTYQDRRPVLHRL